MPRSCSQQAGERGCQVINSSTPTPVEKERAAKWWGERHPHRHELDHNDVAVSRALRRNGVLRSLATTHGISNIYHHG
jgi:hypothetical protein